MAFYDDCQAYEDDAPAGTAYWMTGFVDSYSVTLPPGTYKARVSVASGPGMSSWHDAAPSCQEAATISVPEGSGVTRDLAVIAGSQVSGSVSSSAGEVRVGSVAFYEDCQAWNDDRVAGSYETFWPAATYSVRLAPGTYKARVSVNGGPGITSWHDAAASCQDAATITVTEAPAVTHDLTVRAATGVSGTVSSSFGAISSGSVAFYADCQAYANDEPAGTSSWMFGLLDSYTVGLPPGTYKAYVSVWGGPGVDSWHDAATSCDEATSLTVPDQPSVTRDLTVRSE